ncbi:MAG: TetR/AcrR family transcriptional regulator [Gemmataceae bacterium]|nr:TetR/AcrR family transcriptional regulator [Gemmataceae bacterium]
MATRTPQQKLRGRPRDPNRTARCREEILDSAARIFAENGYPHTDVQVIADTLGVGKGTVYRYFPTKDALFLAAVDRGMMRLIEATGDVKQSRDPLEHMRDAVKAYLSFFQEYPEFAELLIQERAEFRDRKEPTYFARQKVQEPIWRAQFERLIAAGRVRDVPIERIMNVLGDLVYGTMFTNHFSGRHRPLKDQAEDILDVVFHGILTPAERRRRARGAKS